MFKGCISITEINFKLPKSLTNIDNMFENCSSLSSIIPGIISEISANKLHHVFLNCTSLTEIPSEFNCPITVTSYIGLFKDCTSLRSMNNFYISNNVIDISDMFYNCTSLQNIPECFQIPKTTLNLSGCFCNCINLEEIPIDFFNNFIERNLQYTKSVL